MDVLADSTDVTTYFQLSLVADGTDATALTITDIDLQYVRSGEVPVAKVDAVALAATNTAHTDNRAIEIDATDQPGLYRVDWPDAAFAAGAREVLLTVKCALVKTQTLRVNLTPVPANVTQISSDAQSATDLKDFADAGYDPSTNKVQGVVLVDTATTLTNLPAITANWLTNAGIAADTGMKTVRSNTATAGGASTITLDASASAVANFYKFIVLTGGTGVGQGRVIASYNGGTKIATVTNPWDTQPDNTTTFACLAMDAIVSETTIADAVWEEAITDHSGTAGSTAEALNAAGSAGDPWTTTLPGSYTGSQAGKILADVLVDTAEIGAAGAGLTVVATAAELAKVPKSDSTVTWNATALASIQTEANDALVANHLDHLYATSGSVNDVAATTTAFNTTLTEADNFWDDAQITFTSGALAGESKLILAYANANGQILLDEPLTSAPANGVAFVIKAVHAHTKNQIANQVWANGTRTLTSDGLANITAWTVNFTGNLSGSVGSVTTVSDKTGYSLLNGSFVTATFGTCDFTSTMKTSITTAVPTAAQNATATLTTAMTESYAADGAAPTVTQALMLIQQRITEFSIAGVTITIKKLDGTTTAATLTMDSATTPTSATRSG